MTCECVCVCVNATISPEQSAGEEMDLCFLQEFIELSFTPSVDRQSSVNQSHTSFLKTDLQPDWLQARASRPADGLETLELESSFK